MSSITLHVAAGAVFHRDRVLIARRLPSDSLGGKWEFPGGKIEEGETPPTCLVREFDEEFGMEIAVEEFLARTTFPHWSGRGELVGYRARALTLPRVLTAHDAALWVRPESLGHFSLSPADRPIAEKLLSKA